MSDAKAALSDRPAEFLEKRLASSKKWAIAALVIAGLLLLTRVAVDLLYVFDRPYHHPDERETVYRLEDWLARDHNDVVLSFPPLGRHGEPEGSPRMTLDSIGVAEHRLSFDALRPRQLIVLEPKILVPPQIDFHLRVHRSQPSLMASLNELAKEGVIQKKHDGDWLTRRTVLTTEIVAKVEGNPPASMRYNLRTNARVENLLLRGTVVFVLLTFLFYVNLAPGLNWFLRRIVNRRNGELLVALLRMSKQMLRILSETTELIPQEFLLAFTPIRQLLEEFFEDLLKRSRLTEAGQDVQEKINEVLAFVRRLDEKEDIKLKAGYIEKILELLQELLSQRQVWQISESDNLFEERRKVRSWLSNSKSLSSQLDRLLEDLKKLHQQKSEQALADHQQSVDNVRKELASALNDLLNSYDMEKDLTVLRGDEIPTDVPTIPKPSTRRSQFRALVDSPDSGKTIFRPDSLETVAEYKGTSKAEIALKITKSGEGLKVNMDEFRGKEYNTIMVPLTKLNGEEEPITYRIHLCERPIDPAQPRTFSQEDIELRNPEPEPREILGLTNRGTN